MHSLQETLIICLIEFFNKVLNIFYKKLQSCLSNLTKGCNFRYIFTKIILKIVLTLYNFMV